MALALDLVAVEFIRKLADGSASPTKVVATPTVPRVTDLTDHGFVQLPTSVEATPDNTGYGVLLLQPTDDPQVSEDFGWRISLGGGEITSWTVQVPRAPTPSRTVTIGGTTYSAVWLVDLADFTATSSGGGVDLSNYFTKAETNTAAASAVSAHVAAGDPHPQYTTAAEATAAAASAVSAHVAAGDPHSQYATLDELAALPFRSDNTTLTGAAIDDVLAFTQVGATPALGPRKTAKVGNRVAFLGDSITRGSDTPGLINGSCWPTYASVFSKQRIFKARNAGVGGDTTAQMLGRFDTDVTPYRPTVVTIAGGRNDINNGVSLSTFQANIAALVAKARTIGATPVLATITPTNSTNRQPTLDWNVWLRFYAASQGLAILPFHSALVDPVTGNYLAAYNSGDNVHPNDAGCALMGKVAAATLAPLLRDWAPPIPTEVNDTSNLKPDGIFTGTLNGNGEPTGWFVANPTLVTASLDTSDATIKGSAWKGVFANNVSDVQLYRNAQGALTAGHVYAFTGRVKSALTAGRVQAVMVLNGTTNVTAYAMVDLYQQIDDGAFWVTATAPAGATTFNLQLKVMAGAAGTVQWAQVGIYDLTALGVDALV